MFEWGSSGRGRGPGPGTNHTTSTGRGKLCHAQGTILNKELQIVKDIFGIVNTKGKILLTVFRIMDFFCQNPNSGICYKRKQKFEACLEKENVKKININLNVVQISPIIVFFLVSVK